MYDITGSSECHCISGPVFSGDDRRWWIHVEARSHVCSISDTKRRVLQAELDIGKVKFLIVYFVSGLAGNVLSAWWDIQTGSMAISAGASGAIFGIIGALLYVAIRNRGRIGDISGRGLVFMIVLTLYYGFTSGGVDNMAHIGGLLAGFLSGVLLYRKRKDKYRTGISC